MTLASMQGAPGAFAAVGWPYGLYVNGIDVLREPATPARYGVDLATHPIVAYEAGPGDVSTLSFVLDDPSKLLGFGPTLAYISPGAFIQLMDYQRGWPIFGGFLDSWEVVPDFGQQGRSYVITAYGYEALLDTVINPDFDIAAGAFADSSGGAFNEYKALQALCARLPLNAAADSVAGTRSSLAKPIGTTADDQVAGGGIGPAVVMAGQSVRQSFDTFLKTATALGTAAFPTVLTADPWGGVRLFAAGLSKGSVDIPSDYAFMTVLDTVAGALAAENLTWREDHSPGAITNAVYVKGAAAASTGWVVGNTTSGRHESYVTTTGTTEADKQAAAQAVLNTKGVAVGRGSFDLSDFVPVNVHPGSSVSISDAQIGNRSCIVSSVKRTIKSGIRQDWTVTFYDAAALPNSGPATLGAAIRRNQ